MRKWGRYPWQVMGILLLAMALRACQLGTKSLWYDEGFTYILTARLPQTAALQAIIEDVIHPPLYYLLLRPWLALAGSSEYALRYPSMVFGVLTVPLFYRLGRRVGKAETGVLAALLLACSPFHIWYSQDARMYAQVLFLGLGAMYDFFRLVRGRRVWASFIVWSGLAYLTHYSALSLLYVQLASLLPRLRQKPFIRRWFVAQAVALVPLTIWAALVFGVRRLPLSGLGWIPRPGLLAPILTLWNLTTGDADTMAVLVAVFAVGLSIVFVRGFFPWDRDRRLMAWWLGLPMGFLFVFSIWRSYYVDRYLILALPAYLLFLALGAMAWRGSAWRFLTAAVVLVPMLWGTSRLPTDPYFAKEAWRDVTAAIEAGLEQGDVIVLQDFETLVGTSIYRTEEWSHIVLEPGESAAQLDEIMPSHRRVWLVWRSPYESNHRLSKSAPFDVFQVATEPVRSWLADHQEQVALDLRLPGISVLRIDGGE